MKKFLVLISMCIATYTNVMAQDEDEEDHPDWGVPCRRIRRGERARGASGLLEAQLQQVEDRALHA